MPHPKSTQSFKDMEQSGWHAKAASYDDLFGPITRDAMEPLLDAADVKPGSAVLDVASGPGYAAAAAAARKAIPIGVDFADNMLLTAKRHYPHIEFRHGDAENLAFDDSSFDAVVCPFGILHIPEPQRAMAEAFRVLKPGGRYAFTVWAAPEKNEFFKVVLPIIQAHADMEVPLPEAPPIFLYSDHTTCRQTLTDVGFYNVGVVELPLVFKAGSPQRVLDLLHHGTVRTSALLGLQTQEVQSRINAEILAVMEARQAQSGLDLAFPAVMASAQKPLS
ncbi:MAG: methyltransferase domain-containing protein [Gammaproteobacteria bacterium]